MFILVIFKDFLLNLVEFVIKVQVALPAKAPQAKKRCFSSCSAVFYLRFKKYDTNNNITIIDDIIEIHRKGTLCPVKYN